MNEELRDVFAMAALAGLLAAGLSKQPGELWTIDAITKLAYKMADSMVRAREQQ